MLGPRTQAWEEGNSLEGDPVLQPHFLVRQHGAVLIQDQSFLQMPSRVSETFPPHPNHPRVGRNHPTSTHAPHWGSLRVRVKGWWAGEHRDEDGVRHLAGVEPSMAKAREKGSKKVGQPWRRNGSEVNMKW